MAYIGNIPADKYQTLQKQSFSTSATDTYTLSYAVTNPQDLALFINNVRQNPNDAYTVSGTTLTLSSAITGSDTMYAVFLGRAVETVAPAIGSVTNSMLARGEREVAETRGSVGVDEMRIRYKSVGGYGHSPENIQQLAGVENQAKEAQETKLRQYYNHLDKKPLVSNTAALEKWETKRAQLAQGIDRNLIKRTRIAPGGGVDKFAYSTPIRPKGTLRSNNGTIRFGIPSSTNPLSALNRSSAAYGGIESQTNVNADSRAFDLGFKLAN